MMGLSSRRNFLCNTNMYGENTIKLTIVNLTLVVSLLATLPVFADGGHSSSSGSRLKPFQRLIEQQQFQQAIKELEVALVDSPDDADLLNLMAYSHRRLKYFDIAMDYCQQALKLEPKNLGANEYLGKLYLQPGQLEKAEQRLAILD